MISIIIPFYNEKENLPILHREITDAMKEAGQPYEIVFSDDGSNDGSLGAAEKLLDGNTVVVHSSARQGKGPALSAGVKKAKGDIVIFMDADLQDDPRDIPKFLEKMNEGYDLVNGIRMGRQHNALLKAYSFTANRLLRIFNGSPFTDINCGFKAIRKNVFDNVVLYGNNFRFMPLAVFYRGYKVSEVPVSNRKRIHGKAKFGSGKAFIGLIDMTTAMFLYRFSEQPLHFFGTAGSIVFGIGFLMALYMTIERIFFNVLLYRRPALQLAILMMIVGIQIAMTGIIGELIVYLDKRRKLDK